MLLRKGDLITSQISRTNVSEVCAVVVTFHPNQLALNNLTTLSLQLQQTIVVDNGSDVAEIETLRRTCINAGFLLIENGENLGIATALNIGVRHAQSCGAAWLLLFDQDSSVTNGFVEAMIRGFETSVWGERLAILVPRYIDSRLGIPLMQDALSSGGLESAMTSGSLIRTETFAHFGMFVEQLFIDGVDYEYSLRLRQAGMIIEECVDAVLLHSPGQPYQHRLLGRKIFRTANYSPTRRYYQERNKVWIARRYFRVFPGFCLKLFYFSSKDLIKILLAEKGKSKKCLYIVRGLVDGVRGRMGKLQDL